MNSVFSFYVFNRTLAGTASREGEVMGSLVHKIYGGLRLIQVSSDWPKWFREYFTGANDGRVSCYQMRCGTRLHTRRNRSDIHMIDEIWGFRKYDYFGYRVQPGDVVVDIGGHIGTFA